MTHSHLLGLVAVSGIWSWITVMSCRGDRAVELRVLAMHSLGFPLLLIIRRLLGEMSGIEILLYAGVEALFVVAMLNVTYLVKWENPS